MPHTPLPAPARTANWRHTARGAWRRQAHRSTGRRTRSLPEWQAPLVKMGKALTEVRPVHPGEKGAAEAASQALTSAHTP
jgi:hypothetical protein